MTASPSLSLLLLWATLGQVVSAGPLPEKSWQQAVAKTEEILSRDCGSHCVAVGQQSAGNCLRDVVPLLNKLAGLTKFVGHT